MRKLFRKFKRKMAQVIGLGGVFLRFKNPSQMRAWYEDVLGLTCNDYGVLFKFNATQNQPGYLQLGTFEANTDYFGSLNQQVMINFRVDDIEEFLLFLASHHVKIVNEIETYPYGKFLHIEDPEGNRIELWEPIDEEFSSESCTEMR